MSEMERHSIYPAGAGGAESGRKKRYPIWIVGLLLLLGAGVWIWRVWPYGVDWQKTFLNGVAWLQGRGLEAAIWLALLQALLVVSLIPGPYFTLASGFLFGLAGGAVVSIAGSTLGAVAAYWIARRLPPGGAPRWFSSYPGWRLLEAFVVRGGWQMVLSTRLVPLFPFKLSNYYFGRIRFPFWQFFWGTLLGIGPITMISVSVGALASDAASLLGTEGVSRGRWGWTLAILALAAAGFFFASRRARAGFGKSDPRDPRDLGGNR
jgi:uncharacterized membrane protein YdjX (TVP38/TMEM64 family)